MWLVLVRHSRPVTRVRHAGGLSFSKTRVKKKSEDGCPKLKLGVIRKRLPPLLLRLIQPLSPPSSPSRRFLLYAHAGPWSASPCTSGALITSSTQPPEHGSVDETTPPWRFVWGGTTMTDEWDTAEMQTLLAACPSLWASASLMLRLETARYLQPR